MQHPKKVMKVLYVRVSSVEQNTYRQLVHDKDFDEVIEDRCSGSIPFFSRPGGMKVNEYFSNDVPFELHVLSIDRLGRDIEDILRTIRILRERNVCVHTVAQGLRTLNPDGTENDIAKLIIGILGIVAEMERKQIKERTRAGIDLAKKKGVYKGRKAGTKEDIASYLSKKKNKKALELIEKGYKLAEVSRIVGLHPNTLTRLRRISNSFNGLPLHGQ